MLTTMDESVILNGAWIADKSCVSLPIHFMNYCNWVVILLTGMYDVCVLVQYI